MRTTQFSAVRWALAAAAATAGLLATTTTQAQTTLRWKFQEGETLKYSMNQETKIKISVNNQNLENSMRQDIDSTWVVKGVVDGVAEISQTIDRIRTSLETPSAKIDYDSKEGTVPEGPFGQLIGPILTALAGAEISFKMDPRGEVTDVTLPQKVIDAVRNMPGAANAGAMFSEESIKKMITQSTLALPEKPLAPGDSWRKTTEVQAPPVGALVLGNTYTYRGPEGQAGGGVERIDVRIQTEIQAKEGAPQLSVKSQDSQGTFLFDNANGRLSESNLSQKMELVVSAMGTEITQNNETTSTMKLNP